MCPYVEQFSPWGRSIPNLLHAARVASGGVACTVDTNALFFLVRIFMCIMYVRYVCSRGASNSFQAQVFDTYGPSEEKALTLLTPRIEFDVDASFIGKSERSAENANVSSKTDE